MKGHLKNNVFIYAFCNLYIRKIYVIGVNNRLYINEFTKLNISW